MKRTIPLSPAGCRGSLTSVAAVRAKFIVQVLELNPLHQFKEFADATTRAVAAKNHT
jgi:hypothetical protein